MPFVKGTRMQTSELKIMGLKITLRYFEPFKSQRELHIPRALTVSNCLWVFYVSRSKRGLFY
jgi:hypothetical protein